MINLALNAREKNGLEGDLLELAMMRKAQKIISPYLERNIQFFYGGANIPKKAEAYHEKLETETLENSVRKRKPLPVVCRNICEKVVEVLGENGLTAETISCDTDMFGHVDILITTASGNQYIVNFLEDIEMIQTYSNTPNFASKGYFDYRYAKFQGKPTTNGVAINKIAFLSEEERKRIDRNIGYAWESDHGIFYFDDIIKETAKEIEDFRSYLIKEERLKRKYDSDKLRVVKLSDEEEAKIAEEINEMSDDEILEKKLDYIFTRFGDRMDLKGHTNLVMYYSQILLKGLLTSDEYDRIKRFDGIILDGKLPEDSKIMSALDLDAKDKFGKLRFHAVEFNGSTYVFSTKENSYIKLNREELEEVMQYAILRPAKRPTDLWLTLLKNGHALPLIFHPLGSGIIDERDSLVSRGMGEGDREKIVQEIANSINCTDEPITGIRIPFGEGRYKYMYLDENGEFVLEENGKKVIHHYDDKTEEFTTEEIPHVGGVSHACPEER